MKKLMIVLLLAGVAGVPVTARPNPGLNNRTPAVTYLKWEALTSVQQDVICRTWNLTPVEAAVRWNALQAVDQRNLLLKCGLLKATDPGR